VESASRSLRKPTLAKIRAMIEELVRSKVNDGQLDECSLTLKELAIVKDSFAATLRSMLHARIDYPKDEERPPSTNKRSDYARVPAPEAQAASEELLTSRRPSPA